MDEVLFSLAMARCCAVASATAFMNGARRSAGILARPRWPITTTIGPNRCSVSQQDLTTSLSLLASTVAASCSKPSTTPVCAAM